MSQRISLIWAMSKNRVIGKNGGLPWDLPDELARFRTATKGKPVIMGRRTFESAERPLPGRLNIVLSRRGFAAKGVVVVADLDAAFAVAGEDAADECFVIGGTELYQLALPLADRLYATFIDADLDGDTFFPPFDFEGWRVIHSIHHPADERHVQAFDIKIYEPARMAP